MKCQDEVCFCERMLSDQDDRDNSRSHLRVQGVTSLLALRSAILPPSQINDCIALYKVRDDEYGK